MEGVRVSESSRGAQILQYWAILGVSYRKIIPLVYVGYGVVVANSASRWLSSISYPTRSWNNC